MKIFPTILQLCLWTVFYQQVSAQSIVDVNPLNGSANVSIPIYTISNGQVSVPVTLSYASGTRPLDAEGNAGIGWQVSAGGQISRIVRGLPDDATKDMAGSSRIGWMSSSNTAANAINSFSIQNDGINCPKETSDNTYITNNFPFNYDTEPDMFYASAPGLSCQLIYNRITGKFVPITHEDIVISYTNDPATGLIKAFSITSDKGIKYVFSACQTVRETIDDGIYLSSPYFSNQLKQYQSGLEYYNLWYLTSITDVTGNSVMLEYGNGGSRSSVNPVSIYMPGQNFATLLYNIRQSVYKVVLLKIKTNNINADNRILSFGWGGDCLYNITGMGRNFQFTYSNVASAGNRYRLFLRAFTDLGCSTPMNFKFSYGGEALNQSTGDYTTSLPDSVGTKLDYWGYAAFNSNTSLQPKLWINPSNSAIQRYAIYTPQTGGGSYTYATTNGNDRSADLTNFNVGNLVGISYAAGGSTAITYENNSYVDAPSGQVVMGGGIRVKQVIDYDGMDANKNMVRNFAYNDPSTGRTSGKPVSLPVFAFTIPYSGSTTGSNLWNNNTVVSDYDLSDEDHSILYNFCRVSQPGAGSTLYQHYLPATNWDNSATPGCNGCTTADWSPSVNLTARGNCNSTYGPLNSGVATYPFVPNTNYDTERGLLQRVTSFNEAGTKVSGTIYTYQRSFFPSVITAFKYDDFSSGTLSARGYNKYNIYYNTNELSATVTEEVYDSATLTQAKTKTLSYVYGSTQHKLPTQQIETNSDNSTSISNVRYTKDYVASAGPNLNVNAIYNLQQQNTNIPVETWQQVVRNGNTKTTSASLTLFKEYPLGSGVAYLPSQQLKVLQPDGTASFTPYNINGQTANADPGYVPVNNFQSYDVTGTPQTVDDGNRNVKTIVINHATNSVAATFGNAAYQEVGFNDFDTDIASPQSISFTINGSGTFSSNGSHAGNGYGLGTGQTFSKTITSRNVKVSNYIFSIWINAASAGNLNFTLSGGNTSTYSKSFSAGGWTYYEWKLPVNNMSSAFTLSVNANQPISIDDILFYPEIARVSTAAYDPLTSYLIAETNTNGVSSYYKKDQWGRLLFQYDQDKNILNKKSYITPDMVSPTLLSPTVSPSETIANLPANFTANASACVTGVTFSWNFGDGTPVITSFNGYTQSHTYGTTGNFTVTVTASHPTLGTSSSSQTVTVKSPPLTPQICLSGVRSWQRCTGTAISILTCGTNPSDNHTTYATVNSVGGSGFGNLSYVWQISYNGGTSWSNAGSTSPQFSKECDSASTSYSLRCLVTSSSGQTGTSNSVSFAALPCVQ